MKKEEKSFTMEQLSIDSMLISINADKISRNQAQPK